MPVFPDRRRLRPLWVRMYLSIHGTAAWYVAQRGRLARLAIGCAISMVLGGGHFNAYASVPQGIVFDIALERYELQIRVNGRVGPVVPIALGTPSNPTPRGGFDVMKLIANPAYTPGPEGVRRGGTPHRASSDGPLGIAKIPFSGSFQIHAGADPLSLGKPVTLGCVGLTDADMATVISWLEAEGVIEAGTWGAGGQLHRNFSQPARVEIR